MTKNVFLCFFLILVLSSNKCAKEGTAIHLYNTSNSDIFIISKSELIDLKEGFLSDQIINSRTVKTRDNRYVTFENYELETFKNKDKDYLFYILNLSSKKKELDSIIVNENKITISEFENCIYYDEDKIIFSNKNEE